MKGAEPEAVVGRLNALPYPPTVWSHGWVYGVWYCGTAWRKAIYHGQYPATFVRRVLAAFPASDFRLLHLCCGRCRVPGAVNVDRVRLPEADIVADGAALPFRARVFDVALADPPYTADDAAKYGVPMPSRSRLLREMARVTSPGGWILWLDERYPAYRRKELHLVGLIGIVTGFLRRTRILACWRVPGAVIERERAA